MLNFALQNYESVNASNNKKWKRNQYSRHGDTLGFVIIQNVVALTNLSFKEAGIPSCIHLVAKAAEEAGEDAATILTCLVLVWAFFDALVVVH